MFRSRRAAPLPRPLLSAARLGVIGLAVVAAGCASSRTAQQHPAHVAGPGQQNVAGPWKVEIEEDGLPAQLAPRHPRPVPDEPSEPWSPNYGSRPPARPATAAPARVTSIDEEAIIRRAIAEHEMRRRD